MKGEMAADIRSCIRVYVRRYPCRLIGTLIGLMIGTLLLASTTPCFALPVVSPQKWLHKTSKTQTTAVPNKKVEDEPKASLRMPPRKLTAGRALQRVPSERLLDTLVIDPNVFAQRHELLRSIQRTRQYLQSDEGREKFALFGPDGIDSELIQESLERFAILLASSHSHAELADRVRRSFDLYRSVGSDGRGSVLFTGYFRPVYRASRVRSARYPYPLFKKPEDFAAWSSPHPTRVQLEGYNGRGGAEALLHGQELAFVSSRFEAYMIHVQGSAVLEFETGERESIGFAGATDYPFKGVPVEFLRKHKVSWGKLGDFFKVRPAELDRILSLNNRFIFFAEQESSAPIGSLGLPVVDERSIAIDQARLPPGAVSIIRTSLPQSDSTGRVRVTPQSRFVLNLDSGSAIRGPGRVDVFMGTGEEARKRANYVHANGELYYLFAKPLPSKGIPPHIQQAVTAQPVS